MTTEHVAAEPGMSYGYGIMISKDEVTNETIYYHPGGIPGYISMNMYFPGRRLSAVALANYEGFDESAQLAKAFAAVASGRRAKLPSPSAASEDAFSSIE
jgi:CubicO group peptidase (beta-lactamase class C family)